MRDKRIINDCIVFFFFQAEDGIRDSPVTGVQTCALPIYKIVVEPAKMNTAPAILASALIKDISDKQPLMF